MGMKNKKRKFIPSELNTKDRHQLIIGSVGPRPIAFVSTVNQNGDYNLAPYSFFNAFSSNPPIVVFSSNRRVKDNSTKDTLENVKINKGLVINVVTQDIARQMTLTSIEFAPGVSEFDKAGFTPVKADIVTAPIVKESAINMECKVNDIIPLGEHGGAGHLIICEVLLFHVREDVLDENGRIDPSKLQQIGRLGRAYYTKVDDNSIYTIYQNVEDQIIGYHSLPEHIKKSKFLTGNEIAELAALNDFPDKDTMTKVKQKYKSENPEKKARQLIAENKAKEALALLY